MAECCDSDDRIFILHSLHMNVGFLFLGCGGVLVSEVCIFENRPEHFVRLLQSVGLGGGDW